MKPFVVKAIINKYSKVTVTLFCLLKFFQIVLYQHRRPCFLCDVQFGHNSAYILHLFIFWVELDWGQKKKLINYLLKKIWEDLVTESLAVKRMRWCKGIKGKGVLGGNGEGERSFLKCYFFKTLLKSHAPKKK